jgi:hypothetical protein
MTNPESQPQHPEVAAEAFAAEMHTLRTADLTSMFPGYNPEDVDGPVAEFKHYDDSRGGVHLRSTLVDSEGQPYRETMTVVFPRPEHETTRPSNDAEEIMDLVAESTGQSVVACVRVWSPSSRDESHFYVLDASNDKPVSVAKINCDRDGGERMVLNTMKKSREQGAVMPPRILRPEIAKRQLFDKYDAFRQNYPQYQAEREVSLEQSRQHQEQVDERYRRMTQGGLFKRMFYKITGRY